LRAHHAGQRGDRPDRQVDAGRDDHKGLAYGDDRGDGRVDRYLAEVHVRQEVRGQDGKHDTDDDKGAECSRLRDDLPQAPPPRQQPCEGCQRSADVLRVCVSH
jgi:hypothetical protein